MKEEETTNSPYFLDKMGQRTQKRGQKALKNNGALHKKS